jgi:hypothetical protein
MLLRAKTTGDLIEVKVIEKLMSPFEPVVEGRNQAGQEEQDAGCFNKNELTFPSGERLPRCWVDANFLAEKNHEGKH